MILFSGSSNGELTQKVADILSIKLGERELIRFADGECRPWIKEEVRDKTVFILQSLSDPMDEHIIELLLMGDAVLRSAPRKLIAIIPYFGYARQDKQHRRGESVSARVIAKMIEVLPFHEVITIDLHNDAIVGFFRIPVTHLSALPVFAKRLAELSLNRAVVVSPDVGGVKRARNLSQMLDLPIVVMEKKRNLDQKDESEVYQIIGDIKGKTAIIIDDIISTGGTIANAAQSLKEAGASSVIVCGTHGVFAGEAIEKIKKSPIDIMISADTIVPPHRLPERFHQVTLAPLIANAVKKIAGM